MEGSTFAISEMKKNGHGVVTNSLYIQSFLTIFIVLGV